MMRYLSISMITLLQWPWCSMSPSRNQTPFTISFTVFGWASPWVARNPAARNKRNSVNNANRLIGLLQQIEASVPDLRVHGKMKVHDRQSDPPAVPRLFRLQWPPDRPVIVSGARERSHPPI